MTFSNLNQYAVAAIVFGFSLAPELQAQGATFQQCFSDSIPVMTTSWNEDLTFPLFDPALGDLKSVEFRLTTQLTGSMAFESLDMQATTVTMDFAADITVFRPGGLSPILTNSPSQSFVTNVTAFDGNIDFMGGSGASFPNLSVSEVNVVIAPPPPTDLTLFTGLAGNPGTITLPVVASGTSSGSGAGNLIQQFMQEAEAELEVCYNYCLGISKCEGDGGDQMGCTACPCSNEAAIGTLGGCLNSVTSSAQIIADGVPSASNDTLRMRVLGAVPNQIGVLFSGTSGQPTSPANPCFGLQSGIQDMNLDGLRCIGGGGMGGFVGRHQTRNSDVNGDFGFINAPWGPPGGPPQGLISRGGWMPGQTICWQVMYRDDVSQVCMRGVNSTNALEITILP